MKPVKTLQAFYKWKAMLVPSFLERNKRTLNLLEDKLTKQAKQSFNQPRK